MYSYDPAEELHEAEQELLSDVGDPKVSTYVPENHMATGGRASQVLGNGETAAFLLFRTGGPWLAERLPAQADAPTGHQDMTVHAPPLATHPDGYRGL